MVQAKPVRPEEARTAKLQKAVAASKCSNDAVREPKKAEKEKVKQEKVTAKSAAVKGGKPGSQAVKKNTEKKGLKSLFSDGSKKKIEQLQAENEYLKQQILEFERENSALLQRMNTLKMGVSRAINTL